MKKKKRLHSTHKTNKNSTDKFFEMSTDLPDQPITNSINQANFQYGIANNQESKRNITEETST